MSKIEHSFMTMPEESIFPIGPIQKKDLFFLNIYSCKPLTTHKYEEMCRKRKEGEKGNGEREER